MPLSVLVDSNRKRSSSRSLLTKSELSPVLKSKPKFLKNFSYFSESFFAQSSSRESVLPVKVSRIRAMTGLACVTSRDTFKGRSSVSTTPDINRRYSGSSSLQSSRINTLLEYRCSELRSSSLRNLSGGVSGTNINALKFTRPSRDRCRQPSGGLRSLDINL